jgi:hypothetical protein
VPVKERDSTKKREIENKSINTHSSSHSSNCEEKREREISERLLNLLFCQESKVIGHVHQFNQYFLLHSFSETELKTFNSCLLDSQLNFFPCSYFLSL